jgi:hypothetical protein
MSASQLESRLSSLAKDGLKSLVIQLTQSNSTIKQEMKSLLPSLAFRPSPAPPISLFRSANFRSAPSEV